MRKFTIFLIVSCFLFASFIFGVRVTLPEPSLVLQQYNEIEASIQRKVTSVAGLFAPEDGKPWVETLSWKPRVFLYHNFLTSEECQELVDLGSPNVVQSLVVSEEGENVKSSARTSQGVFLGPKFMKKSPLLRNIEKRIADWTHLPPEFGESFYLLRYDTGQQYKAHTDYFSSDQLDKDEGNRYATVVIYLKTPDEGGDTLFPKTGLRVKAQAGTAVLFYNMNPTHKPDPITLHAGEPVIKGSKWALTKWIRSKQTPYWYDNLSDEEKEATDNADKLYLASKQNARNNVIS